MLSNKELEAIVRRNGHGLLDFASEPDRVDAAKVAELIRHQAVRCIRDYVDDDDMLDKLISLYSDLIEYEGEDDVATSVSGETFLSARETEEMLMEVFIAGYRTTCKGEVSSEYLRESYSSWPDVVVYRSKSMYPVKLMQDIAYLAGCHEGLVQSYIAQNQKAEHAKAPVRA